MTVKVSLVGTPEQVLAATRTHWQSLGLDEAPLDALAASLATYGTLAYARADSIDLFGHLNDAPQIVDLYVPEADVSLWQAPLASADTTTVQATRGAFTVPVAGDVAIVRPINPRYWLAGLDMPVEEPNGDFPQPPEWYQRTPGLEPASAVPQVGTIERIGDDRYVCEVAQSNVGGTLVNYFAPDALNGGWRRVAAPGGGLDPWSPGTYQLGAEVLYEPDGSEWRNRRDPNTQAFAPPVSDSGWMQIGPGAGPHPWKHVGNEGYPIDWEVTSSGRRWRNTLAGNTWAPGVFGWTDLGPA